MNEAYNIDCMEFMRRVPSKYFDLAVVDPPYGIEKGFKETSRVTGKWCPRPWMGDDTNTYYGTSGNEQWKKFKERLSGEELDMNIEEARKQLPSCADTGDTPSAWARDAAEFCKRKGIFNGDGAGNYGWQQPITREAVAQILYNAFESAGMLDAIPDKK